MPLEISFNGVYLSRSDFGNSIQDYIAFSIAFACDTHCRDKEAALELLQYEAEKLIEVVKAGKTPD